MKNSLFLVLLMCIVSVKQTWNERSKTSWRLHNRILLDSWLHFCWLYSFLLFSLARYYNCVPFAGCVMVGPSSTCHSRVKTFEELPLEMTSHKTQHVRLRPPACILYMLLSIFTDMCMFVVDIMLHFHCHTTNMNIGRVGEAGGGGDCGRKWRAGVGFFFGFYHWGPS